MSLSEVLVVIIIAILVCDIKDLKFIIKEFYKLKKCFLEIRQEVLEPFEQELVSLQSHADELIDQDSLSEINFYLQKITALNQSYSGQYSLKEIKKYYHQLIVKQDE